MVNGATLNMYVFLLAFASAFMLGGKRPFLALSTRGLLVGLLALACGYAVSDGQWYRGILAAATAIANVLFIAFATIDFRRWQLRRSD